MADPRMPGMLPIAGTGVSGSINMNDPDVKAAVARLRAKGLPLNRVNIAEELAVGIAESAQPDGIPTPGATRPAMGERVAPAGSIEEKLLREAERKRKMGPPPGMVYPATRGQVR